MFNDYIDDINFMNQSFRLHCRLYLVKEYPQDIMSRLKIEAKYDYIYWGTLLPLYIA